MYPRIYHDIHQQVALGCLCIHVYIMGQAAAVTDFSRLIWNIVLIFKYENRNLIS